MTVTRLRRLSAALVALALAACTSAPTDPAATPEQPASVTEEPAPAAPSESSGAATLVVGVGDRPVVRWPAVDGAVTYRLTVAQDDGPPWAWEGDTTEVVLGGGSGEGGRGFRLTSAAVVTVTAHGEDGAALRLDQVRVDRPAG